MNISGISDEPLIECIPNFSEGRNKKTITFIAQAIRHVKEVKLLHIDSGKAANRTVMTFAGPPEAVIEAAFLAIKKAAEYIDMRKHKGEHPRIGATDVCPLVPLANISMEETVKYAHKLAERVGMELDIPVFMYEHAAALEERKNLANLRAGEYEGLTKKLTDPKWIPDYGPAVLNAITGVTVIGARDFLIAYNINLNSKSAAIAKQIACDIRESGKIVKNKNGESVRVPGSLRGVKAIGWYIEEFQTAQVSMNLVNINATPMHVVFEEVRNKAGQYNVKVTGSELIGLVPLKALADAGQYFLRKKYPTKQFSREETLRAAVTEMGLDQLKDFNPDERIIEYLLGIVKK